MTNTTKKIAKRSGTVVSNSMKKTIVVAVETYKTNPKYLKKYTSTKRFKVHDEEEKCKVGDKVEFVQCKPISKDKRHKVL